MKRIITLILIFVFFTNISEGQSGMLLPSSLNSIDQKIGLYPLAVDTLHCYIVYWKDSLTTGKESKNPLLRVDAETWTEWANNKCDGKIYWVENICLQNLYFENNIWIGPSGTIYYVPKGDY